MNICIPDFCLVALVGKNGSANSTFAARHFQKDEVVSPGSFDGEDANYEATSHVFNMLLSIVEKRLKSRELVVVDASNVGHDVHTKLVALARTYYTQPIALVLNTAQETSNNLHAQRKCNPSIIRKQTRLFNRCVKAIQREGFRQVYQLSTLEDVERVEITRRPLRTDRRNEIGPFDIIGDVHGCCDELEALLAKLGYETVWSVAAGVRSVRVTPPQGRRALFVGDLVDRGPRSPDVLRIAMAMAEAGSAFCVPGNHDVKFLCWLNGCDVKLSHGLETTVRQFAHEAVQFRDKVRSFIKSLVSHQWLDDGRLVLAHAGIKEEMIGRSSCTVRRFCLYGETTGETDKFGLPIRYNWAAEYSGQPMIVYGHTPVPDAKWVNNTICLDTGCCFGGKLTSLRYPEKELVQVFALHTYTAPVRPLTHPPPRPGVQSP